MWKRILNSVTDEEIEKVIANILECYHNNKKLYYCSQ